MSNRKRTILKIAIACTAIPDIGAGTATAAIAAIMAAMPDTDPALVQTIGTIPSLFLCLCTPLYAKSTHRIRKKTLLKIGFVLFFLGGFMPVFFRSIWPILFCRCLCGMAAAIMMPITVDLAVDFFEGKEQRSMLGYCACITSIGGIVFQSLGGILGNIQWNYCFLASLFALPFFVFSLIFLPNMEPKARPMTETAGEGMGASAPAKRDRLSGKAILMIAFMAVWELGLFIFLTTASNVLVGEGIADTAQTGLTVSLFTVGGLILSFFYERIFRVTKKYTLVPAYAFTFLGFLVFFLGHNWMVMNCAALLIGIGYGLCTPASFTILANTVGKASRTWSVSLGYTAKGIGGFINPFVFKFVHQALGTQLGRTTFQYGVIIMGVLTILVFFFARSLPKSIESDEPDETVWVEDLGPGV